MATIASIAASMNALDAQTINLNTISSVFTPVAKRADGTGLTSSENPEGVINNWGAALWDASREWYVVYGGGHAGYIGNESYYFDMADLSWHLAYLPTEMINDTTNGILHPVWVNGVTTVETLAKKAVHSYSQIVKLPALDRYFYGAGADYYGPGDPPNNDWSHRYTGVDFVDQDLADLVKTGPWLVDPNLFDETKTGGDTGTGADPADLGANVFQNRDYITTRGLQYEEHRRLTADQTGATNKVFAWSHLTNNLSIITLDANPANDTIEVITTNQSNLSNIENIVYIPHLNILVGTKYRTGNGTECLFYYDLTLKFDQWQVINLDVDNITSWPVNDNSGMTYDDDRKCIFVYDESGSNIVEISVPDEYPIGFKARTVTTNQPLTETHTNGPNSRFRYAGSGLILTVPEGANGNVWAIKVPSDLPHPTIQSKSEINTGYTLKAIAGLTPKVVIPIIESSGTTVHEFVTQTDLTVAGTLGTHQGQAVLDGGMNLPINVGDLSTSGCTIVYGFWRTPNDTGSGAARQHVLESSDGSTFLHRVNVFTGKYYGNFADTRPWLGNAASELVFVVLTHDPNTNITRICSGGDMDERTETRTLNIGNNAVICNAASSGLDKLAFMAIYEGVPTDVTANNNDDILVNMATLPYDTMFEVGVSNNPPVASAGPDQNVNVNELVTLDGSGSSDPDGTITAYAWTQTSGTAVTLSDSAISNPTFTSPSSNTTLTFDLVVTDNEATDSVADSVTIDVIASSDANITVAGLPDADYTVKIDDDSGNTLHYGTLTFASGSTTVSSLPVAAGSRYYGYVADPVNGDGITGVTV